MKNSVSTWDEVRRMADELELQIHLGTMDARDRWRALRPQIEDIERLLTRSGQRASEAIERELTTLADSLRRLRDDLVKH